MPKKKLLISVILVLFVVFACQKEEEYSPVTLDLGQVPYQKLSDYHFFEGPLKDQKPVRKVIPYQPASALFSDYAHKKRFVWMPQGAKATYNGDGNVFDFPLGSVLIKTFYYDNVLPTNFTKMLETRLLVMKSDGWKAYTYVWNEDQTEATLEATNQGLNVPLTFTHNGISKSVTFRIPSQNECITCHKFNPTGLSGGEKTIAIGPKPQNINLDYNYDGQSMNQIAKWKAEGYLGNDVPANINSTVNWEDVSKPLESRVRSYIDMNCGHCHRQGGHCDYVNMRFNYSNTDLATFGVCMTPLFSIPNANYIVNSGRAARSVMHVRMNSTVANQMMPIIGRSVVHTEAVQMIESWINSLPTPCQ